MSFVVGGHRSNRWAFGLLAGAVGLQVAGWARAQELTPAAAKECFEQAKQLSEADGGKLWGKPLYGPMLLADVRTRRVIANQADGEGKLKGEDGVFTGTLPPEENIANTATRWAGVKWTMLMWPISAAGEDRGRLLVHELFHRVQDDLGLPMSNPGNAHLDSKDGRVWLQLEWRALAKALRSAAGDRRPAVEDALIFRAHRQSLFPKAADEERGLEMNEGLAEYTGRKLCGLAAEQVVEHVAARLDSAQGEEGFMRGFAYISGPAYGLLLDDADAGWRRGLNAQADLGRLLVRALSIKLPANVEAAARERSSRYDSEALIAAETQREQARAERMAEHRRRFVQGPVLRLKLSASVQYSYNPYGLEALDDVGTVYPTVRVSDEWGILEVSGGALIKREGARVSEVVVPAPAEIEGLSVSSEGWKLELKAGWKLVRDKQSGEVTARPGS